MGSGAAPPAPARDVRVRSLGWTAQAPAPCARPVGEETALLCGSWQPALLLERHQEYLARRRRSPHSRSPCDRRVPLFLLHHTGPKHLPGSPEASGSELHGGGTGASPDRSLLDARLYTRRDP